MPDADGEIASTVHFRIVGQQVASRVARGQQGVERDGIGAAIW